MLDTHQMTVRLPETVYEALRREAFARRIPMNEIVVEALQAHMNEFFSANPKA